MEMGQGGGVPRFHERHANLDVGFLGHPSRMFGLPCSSTQPHLRPPRYVVVSDLREDCKRVSDPSSSVSPHLTDSRNLSNPALLHGPSIQGRTGAQSSPFRQDRANIDVTPLQSYARSTVPPRSTFPATCHLVLPPIASFAQVHMILGISVFCESKPTPT